MPPWAHQPDRGISGHTLHVIFLGRDAVRLRPSASCAPPRMGACREIQGPSARASPSLRERRCHPRRSSAAAPYSPDRHRRRHVLHPHAAAYLTAWRDAGLARAVDHAITVSGSGGAVGAYLSGLPHRAVQMFEHLAVSGFVTGKAWYKRRISLPQLGDVLRGMHSPVAFRARADLRPPHLLARRGHAADGRELPARCQDRRGPTQHRPCLPPAPSRT